MTMPGSPDNARAGFKASTSQTSAFRLHLFLFKKRLIFAFLLRIVFERQGVFQFLNSHPFKISSFFTPHSCSESHIMSPSSFSH